MQFGGGKCSLCDSIGTTRISCPLNPLAKNGGDPIKHPLAKSSALPLPARAPSPPRARAPSPPRARAPSPPRARAQEREKSHTIHLPDVKPMLSSVELTVGKTYLAAEITDSLHYAKHPITIVRKVPTGYKGVLADDSDIFYRGKTLFIRSHKYAYGDKPPVWIVQIHDSKYELYGEYDAKANYTDSGIYGYH